MDNSLLRKIMKDIRVELTEEFDLNFERKAFFDRKWTPLSPNYQPTTGATLTPIAPRPIMPSFLPAISGPA